MDLPTAPAKATDNRSFNGVGDDPDATVQAEAIPPDAMASLLEEAIAEHMDLDIYQDVLSFEEDEREKLVEAVSRIELR